MSFPITGLGIVNALGTSADAVAASLRRGPHPTPSARISAPLPDAPSRAHAMLRQAALELDPTLARARKRWGPRRLAALLGCTRDAASLLDLVATITEARAPIYAITTGPLASAHAVVSATGLLRSDLADAVAIATVHADDTSEGAAWLLLERQATADFELVHAVDDLQLDNADCVFTDTADRRHHRAPAVALAGYWGDLGPAHTLTSAIAAVLALEHGFVPASCSRDGHLRTHALDRDCDRVACTATHGAVDITLAIGARSS